MLDLTLVPIAAAHTSLMMEMRRWIVSVLTDHGFVGFAFTSIFVNAKFLVFAASGVACGPTFPPCLASVLAFFASALNRMLSASASLIALELPEESTHHNVSYVPISSSELRNVKEEGDTF